MVAGMIMDGLQELQELAKELLMSPNIKLELLCWSPGLFLVRKNQNDVLEKLSFLL